MIRKAMMLLALAALASCATQNAEPQSSATPKDLKRPNVIIIYGDDVGYGDIGVYGVRGAVTSEFISFSILALR